MKESAPKTPIEDKETVDRIHWQKFNEEDQKLMKSGEWDYMNPELELNKLKEQIESTDDSSLSEQELSDKENALWVWYHHGSQIAYGKYNDTKTALEFIDKALFYREKIGLDNQITPLLKLLYLGELEKARVFAEGIPEKVMDKDENGIEKEVDNVERETGLALVGYFEQQASR